MTAMLRVGCAMWAYKAWQGRHFPPQLARREQLPTYATWCNAVDGNTTHYAVPASRTVAAWARDAPDDFRFVFKLPRTITHRQRLRDADGELREFLARVEPLGARAEQLSIQLPGSFGPDDVDVLGRFLRRLPSSHRFAVELRHHAFYDDGAVEAATAERLAGGGVDFRVTKTLAARVQADYLWNDVSDSVASSSSGFRVSAGIVYRFGIAP